MSKSKWVIIILVAIGIIGILTLGNNKKVSTTPSPAQNNKTSATGKTPVTPISGPTGSVVLKSIFSSDPGASATKAQLEEFGKKINAAAQDSKTLTISECLPAPEVLRVKAGQSITVKNQDTKAHVFESGTDKILEIGASQTKDIVLSFPKGPGTYGYNCDGAGPVGIFQFVEAAK